MGLIEIARLPKAVSVRRFQALVVVTKSDTV
jgi:hypothetical protein